MLAYTQASGDEGVRRHLFGEFNDFLIQELMRVAGFGGEGFPIDLYTLEGSDTYYVEPPLPTTTMEVCVPLEDLEKVFALILELTNDVISPTVLDLRYTAASNATLSPSKFAPISAWISFSSLDIPASREAYQLVFKALEEQRRDDISFTYHWGKDLPINNEWIEKSHGRQALQDWKRQRRILLPTRAMRRLFSNDYTDLLGLTGIVETES